VTELEENEPVRIAGRELAEVGLLVRIPSTPGATIVTYKRIDRP
jgi:hypothetical protein